MTLRTVLLPILLVMGSHLFAANALASRDPQPQALQSELIISKDASKSYKMVVIFKFGENRTLNFNKRTGGSGHLVREKTWRNLDPQCVILTENSIIQRHSSCGVARFEISMLAIREDRVYPGALDLGNEGLLLHTGYLSVNERTELRLSIPASYIVLGGNSEDHKRSRRNIIIRPSDDEYLVMAHESAVKRLQSGLLLVKGENIKDSLLASIKKIADETWRVTKERLGGGRPSRQVVVVLHADSAVPDGGYHGDVTNNGVVRVSLFGNSWAAETLERSTKTALALFIAHELIHAVQGDNEGWPNWIVEGNAELLGMIVASNIGAVERGDVIELVAAAVSECMLIAYGKSWSQFDSALNFGGAPYSCGLAMHAYTFVEMRPDEALRYWAEVFRGERDFGKDLPPIWFHTTNSPTPYEFLVDKAGLEDEGGDLQEDEQRDLNVFKWYMMEVMSTNCGLGRFGFFIRNREIVTDSGAGCEDLANRTLIAVEGQPFNSWRSAAMTLHQKCITSSSVSFSTRAGTSPIDLKCPALPKTILKGISKHRVQSLFSRLFFSGERIN